jgi:hypothetical protein
LHTAEEIAKLDGEYEVYFPVKDKAVDMIVSKGLDSGNRSVVTLQVKASRMFEGSIEEGMPSFWIKLSPQKLERFSKKVDLYVFVFYETVYQTKGVPRFRREYLVIPTDELIRRSKNKKGWARGWLNYYFVLYPDGRVIEVRDVNKKTLAKAKRTWWRDYTEYKTAFHLMETT